MGTRLKALQPFVITCVIAGLVLSILAPFGTAQFALPGRLAFWVGLCFVGGFGAALASTLVDRLSWKAPPLLLAFFQSLLASIFVATALTAMNLQVFGSVSATQFLTMLFYIWVVAMTISAIGVLTHRDQKTEGNSQTPALYERLPMNLKSAEIYALAAEDHYVRVITSNGDEMILMRLSDAIKEVAPLKGLSPHRSWWVAEAGVEKLTKSNGKSEIELKSGSKVPVSRNGAKTVKEAGWW